MKFGNVNASTNIYNNIELVLFENDAGNVPSHLDQGVFQFMVDMEVLGKDVRQLGFDTEIRPGTMENIRAISAIPGTVVWARLNHYGEHTASEVESAILAGANILLLPMVVSFEEVVKFISHINKRCKAGIMIETLQAAAAADQLNSLALDYAFFGLNDFAISRGGGSIFRALVDGTVQNVCNALPDVRFGVAGLTDINKGYPIPCKRIVEELSRLGCDFTFLRRSFRKDSMDVPTAEILAGIYTYWHQCLQRTPVERERDHAALGKLVNEA